MMCFRSNSSPSSVPEAVAFAFVAGVDQWLSLRSIHVGLITSVFGGRPCMISGATGAMAVVMVEPSSNLMAFNTYLAVGAGWPFCKLQQCIRRAVHPYRSAPGNDWFRERFSDRYL